MRLNDQPDGKITYLIRCRLARIQYQSLYSKKKYEVSSPIGGEFTKNCRSWGRVSIIVTGMMMIPSPSLASDHRERYVIYTTAAVRTQFDVKMSTTKICAPMLLSRTSFVVRELTTVLFTSVVVADSAICGWKLSTELENARRMMGRVVLVAVLKTTKLVITM
jgi:hypothetical protein